mmetsp:Transcript_107434/g.210605  ORF Transcript_107434/g.210605 Transcript_107434/m.210605 type:complete len:238 (+) Transcript_107434:568-1281(+)
MSDDLLRVLIARALRTDECEVAEDVARVPVVELLGLRRAEDAVDVDRAHPAVRAWWPRVVLRATVGDLEGIIPGVRQLEVRQAHHVRHAEGAETPALVVLAGQPIGVDAHRDLEAEARRLLRLLVDGALHALDILASHGICLPHPGERVLVRRAVVDETGHAHAVLAAVSCLIRRRRAVRARDGQGVLAVRVVRSEVADGRQICHPIAAPRAVVEEGALPRGHRGGLAEDAEVLEVR